MDPMRALSSLSSILLFVVACCVGCGSNAGDGKSGGGGAASSASASSAGATGSGGVSASGSRASGGALSSISTASSSSGGSSGVTSHGGAMGGTSGSSSDTACGSLPDTLVSKYHPTDASSTTSDTYSMNINDGSVDTVWKAASSDKAWCWISLENSFDLDAFRLTFPTSGNYRYTIDVSSDGNQWRTVVDESKSTSTAQVRCATGKFPSIQTVRVSFVGGPSAGLAELEVSGVNVQ